MSSTAVAATSPDTPADTNIQTLKQEYLAYLDAQDANDYTLVANFLSPGCRQLARQNPAWNLSSRDEIMQILSREADPAKKPERGKVEMRALTEDEKESLPALDKEQAGKEGWEGLRVTLEDKDESGMRVEVCYYWRREGGRWLQCFHDLLWFGPRDGIEREGFGESVFGTK
jgi:hypothetical protein